MLSIQMSRLKLFRKLKDNDEKLHWTDLNNVKIDYQVVRVIDATIISRFLESEEANTFKKGDNEIIVAGADAVFSYNKETKKVKKVKEELDNLEPTWLPTLNPAILKTIAKDLEKNLENLKNETAKINLDDR